MKTIFHVEHDGVFGIIESPDELDPTQPLESQLHVTIGFDRAAPLIDGADFAPRARLVVLELLNHLHEKLGIQP